SALRTIARMGLMLLGTIVACLLLFSFWQVTCGSLGVLFGDRCMPWVPTRSLPTRSLLVGSPEPRNSSHEFIGYDRFTADELNRTYPGSSRAAISGPLRFVPA